MKKWIIPIIIVIVIGGGLLFLRARTSVPILEIEEARIEDLVGETLSISGSLIYPKMNITSKVQGTVSYIKSKGEAKKGDILVKIDSRDFSIQEDALNNKIKQQTINLGKTRDRSKGLDRDLELSKTSLQNTIDTLNNLIKRKDTLKLFTPFDGVIYETKFKKGELTTIHIPLLSLYKKGSTYILLNVPEKDLEFVKGASSLEITLPLKEDATYSGKIQEIPSVVESDKTGARVVRVKVSYTSSEEFPLNATTSVKFKKDGTEKTISGYVESDEKVSPYSKAGGEVVFIRKVGENVKTGDLLVELKSEDLDNQIKQQEYLVKQAEVGLQKILDSIDSLKLDLQVLELQLKDLYLQKDNLLIQKDNYEIKASFDGEVLSTSVEVGDTVNLQQLLMVVKKGMSYVQGFLSEDDYYKVKLDDEMNIVYQEHNMKGKVFEISSLSQLSKEGLILYPVKISLEEKLSIPEGATMEISRVLAFKEKVLTVSLDSVFEKSGEKYVYVATKGTGTTSIINLRKIKTDLEGEERIEILSGLQEGERVVLKPDSKIKDGLTIRTKED